MDIKKAQTHHPILPLLAERWSPYAFADRPVSTDDLRSLFEAARWAASCFNEQPWTYMVATRNEPDEFERLLSCLVEGNRAWARQAPVLALGLVSTRFSRNHKDNRTATHDLGLASATLVLEATSRGLCVHQMAGILPDRARELYGFPEGVEAWTALALGYRGDPATLPERLKERDISPRKRKAIGEFVFSGTWGKTSPWAAARPDGTHEHQSTHGDVT